jgi:cobalamin synthase
MLGLLFGILVATIFCPFNPFSKLERFKMLTAFRLGVIIGANHIDAIYTSLPIAQALDFGDGVFFALDTFRERVADGIQASKYWREEDLDTCS